MDGEFAEINPQQPRALRRDEVGSGKTKRERREVRQLGSVPCMRKESALGGGTGLKDDGFKTACNEPAHLLHRSGVGDPDHGSLDPKDGDCVFRYMQSMIAGIAWLLGTCP